MIGYRVRSERDLHIFYNRFKCIYDIREWGHTYTHPLIFYVENGEMSCWGTDATWRGIPVYEMHQFNDYYEEIFYNKKR